MVVYVLTQCQAFGPPPKDHATGGLPQHGFARNSTWEYMGKSSSESGALSKGGDDSVKLDFGLSAANIPDEAKKAWPYKFSLVYSVTLGKDGLQTMLNVRNEGEESFEFQTLLHSYFKIDVRIRILLMTISTLTTFAGHLQNPDQRPRQHNLHRQSPQRLRAHAIHALPLHHWRN